MILYRHYRTNEAFEPWNVETIWAVEITFNWRAFLLGFSAYDDIYAINIGPFAFIHYHNSRML